MRTIKFALLLIVAAAFFAQIGHAQVLDPTFPDQIYNKENTINRRPIPYTHLREADVMWSKRVWRTIELREKFNHPLYYPETPINNRKSLFDVIKKALLDGDIFAFDNAALDDEFQVKMSKAQLQDLFVQVDSTQQTEDPNNPGTYIISPVRTELTSIDVKAYWIKEDWFFDKQRSVMDVRILGLCPLQEKKDPSSGEVVGYKALFWVYFPQCRPVFARSEVYNTKSDAERRSLDDIFWKRMFQSYIHKETNVFDRTIRGYTQGLDALFESERIKNDIFVYEHDLWHF
ncbi:MAG: gliding motility protein GldN [Bacteroidetes bacterium]|nr:gliding motility protein GldN [Bacteroidota bacterium]